MNKPKKILLVRPDRLGDLILSLPVAEALKKEIPGVQVHYLASRYSSEISPMADYIDGWLIDEGADSGRMPVLKLKDKIKSEGFDCVIELKPSWRTAFAGFLAGTGIRIGTFRRVYSLFYNNRINIPRKSSGFHQTDLELKHLQPLGIESSGLNPHLTVTPKGKSEAIALLRLEGKSYIVIHPGSGGSSLNWPREKYLSLADMITSRTDYKVVITNHDNNIGEFKNCLNLGGKTDLETLGGVLHGARLFISGSTGPLHLADALGTTCVSLYPNRADIGPVRWGPRRNLEGVLMTADDCRCGRADNCRCLEQVSAEDAYNKIETVLSSANNMAVEKE